MGLVRNSALCRETLKCQNVHAAVVLVELCDNLLTATVRDPNHVLTVFDGERVRLRPALRQVSARSTARKNTPWAFFPLFFRG
jgi:hypothetical protein